MQQLKILTKMPKKNYITVPVMLRVTGYDHEKVREIASQVSNAMASNPHITHINWDWTIMLTAAAAILGMIPLMASTFWGPMAVAIAGGLFCATVLTLLVLPTMYAAWFKVTPNSQPEQKEPATIPCHAK
ncbi:AcrB/AcrD/AcrF family protein [Sporomusa ovata DSM 2662]|uniref:Acriflavin resistance protein n=1 Tax=Sporomusa ovata TaxID=2378 RepID=A0A0U1L3P1_9FIRM|nr:cation/multidrug efflux pump [Sporomusa ovata DSM 2662]CQR73524.1 Acriflavin resistance protein [Sporomusa ovata]